MTRNSSAVAAFSPAGIGCTFCLHPRRGGFLPPVPLPRRMWAGGRLEFLQPLRVGESVTRASRIVDVYGKEGRSGSLLFVRVRHEIENPAGLALIGALAMEATAMLRGP